MSLAFPLHFWLLEWLAEQPTCGFSVSGECDLCESVTDAFIQMSTWVIRRSTKIFRLPEAMNCHIYIEDHLWTSLTFLCSFLRIFTARKIDPPSVPPTHETERAKGASHYWP